MLRLSDPICRFIVQPVDSFDEPALKFVLFSLTSTIKPSSIFLLTPTIKSNHALFQSDPATTTTIPNHVPFPITSILPFCLFFLHAHRDPLLHQPNTVTRHKVSLQRYILFSCACSTIQTVLLSQHFSPTPYWSIKPPLLPKKIHRHLSLSRAPASWLLFTLLTPPSSKLHSFLLTFTPPCYKPSNSSYPTHTRTHTYTLSSTISSP